MRFELKRIQREVGITFVYVTHDQEEALTMSGSRVANAGNVQTAPRPRSTTARLGVRRRVHRSGQPLAGPPDRPGNQDYAEIDVLGATLRPAGET